MVMSALSAGHWATVAPEWTSDPLYFRTGDNGGTAGAPQTFTPRQEEADRQTGRTYVCCYQEPHQTSFFILHSS